MLASDEFEGRAPGTAGETKTINYLVETFRGLGLEPGGANGSWTQEVPLLRTQIETPRTLQIDDQWQGAAAGPVEGHLFQHRAGFAAG